MYSGTVMNSGPHGAQSLCRFGFYALRCCYVVDLRCTGHGIPVQGYPHHEKTATPEHSLKSDSQEGVVRVRIDGSAAAAFLPAAPVCVIHSATG